MLPILDPGSYTHSAFALPIGMVAVLSLAVGVWAVWHERGSRVSLSLLATTLALALYLGGFAIMAKSATPEVGVFWGKLAYLGVPFIVPSIYQFSMDLLGLRDRRRVWVRAAWAVGLVYAILAVGTNVLIVGVRPTSWGYVTHLSLWNLPILAWSSLVVVLALRDYLAAYREAGGIQRARIRLFAIPILIASSAFVDYAASFGFPVAPWGFVFFAFFLLSAAWAVARYHLPDLTPAFAAEEIVRTMAEPLLVCDHGGTIAFVNPAAVRLLGWSEGALVGQRLHILFGTALARRLLEEVPGSPAGAASLEVEVEGRVGEPIALSISTGRITGKGGQHVGTVVVARDVRDRNRAAAELERREQRFRALIEHARDTITIIDGDGRITYESPATREILGYDPDGSLGTSLFDRVHPEDLPGMRELFADIIDRPGGLAESEARILHAQGSYRGFEFRAVSLLEHPAVRGIVINARDVTEERQLAAQLQQAQKMEAIGRLAGGVAHDFNNILTAVQGNVALIRDEIPDDSAFAAELDEIGRGADRASRLTDQLLSFSRRQVVRVEVLELNEVVRDMRVMLERLIGESIALVTRFEAEPATIRADRSQLEQVVLNLVVNARDAVGGAGRVEIATRSVEVDEAAAMAADFQLVPGSYVLMTVTDDGRGMDGDTLNRLFEPFFTTKAPGRGTGLGLSTVYGAVRQAAGYIGVESRPGMGATFSIYLPRVHDHPDQPPAPEPPVELAGEGDVVLVVEDEGPVRTLIARVLERRGYHVLTAEDGPAALRVAGEHAGPIHLLIADLVMPGLSGREVAERLAPEHPEMAIILISGYTADEVVRQGILTGEREFLPKPFTPNALARKVAAVLGQKRQRG